ncbi:pickpocket protein 28-like [Photinus pyralis]|uniref:pickpocket protein 28-like n=1 Tax=Photinus pyralis TaxID=7054 RepID=UPI0012671F37|nr:pickpocket protein 28-like [Photinus pyralis]
MRNETEKPHPTFAQNCRSYVSECCSNCSVHGFKFLGERNRNIFERILWLTTLIVCITLCASTILQAYHKWQRSPVVVSFATTETPVWDIPFPAVTICPEARAERSIVNYTDLVLMVRRGEQLSRQQRQDLSYISQICSHDWEDEVGEEEDFLTEDFYEFLFNVKPNVDHAISECVLFGKSCTKDIRALFTPIVSPDGVCLSFNLLDRRDVFEDIVATNYYTNRGIPHQKRSNWTLERGYSATDDNDVMPRRTFVPGIAGGLQLTLWVESKNVDYVCSDALQGYKIILHSPSQFPFTEGNFIRVGLNQVLVASVKPIMVMTSKRLRSYHPDNRECYFMEERKLKFFKKYDQNNCIHECLANYTLHSCGCVPFEMPRINSTPICGRAKRECVRNASALFLVNKNVKILDNVNEPNFVEKCDCRQTCSSIRYETEISQTEWRWKRMERTLHHNGTRKKLNDEYSKIQIFFRDLQFITSERQELYGLMDFLSSCGGLLGYWKPLLDATS